MTALQICDVPDRLVVVDSSFIQCVVLVQFLHQVSESLVIALTQYVDLISREERGAHTDANSVVFLRAQSIVDYLGTASSTYVHQHCQMYLVQQCKCQHFFGGGDHSCCPILSGGNHHSGRAIEYIETISALDVAYFSRSAKGKLFRAERICTNVGKVSQPGNMHVFTVATSIGTTWNAGKASAEQYSYWREPLPCSSS
jgi:hypothetical protein